MSLVLLPYRFTLFSNKTRRRITLAIVLLPYRFTLFSNGNGCTADRIAVLLPYRFTLFSNSKFKYRGSFQFYYLIDLHYSQTVGGEHSQPNAFYYLIDLHYSQTLQRSQMLKFRFYYLIDLHYSQTILVFCTNPVLFYYLIDLHYSQTFSRAVNVLLQFYYLIDLHYSQTAACVLIIVIGFTTLQIYTILKLISSTKTCIWVLLPYRFTLFSNIMIVKVIYIGFYYLIDLHYSQTAER